MSIQRAGATVLGMACLTISLLAAGCASRQDGPAAGASQSAHVRPALASPPASLMTPAGY